MASVFECENFALYHDPQDQRKYPFRFAHADHHHGQSGANR